MVVDGEQEGLFILGGPPRVDGGVVLPQFAQTGPFSATAGLGDGGGRTDQEREVTAGVSSERFAVALKSKAGGQFVGDELIVGRSLEWQEGLQELLDLGGPGAAMVATGELEPGPCPTSRSVEAFGSDFRTSSTNSRTVIKSDSAEVKR